MRSKILQYLSDNSVIIHGQHDFVSKKSCFTNLLETFEDWTLLLIWVMELMSFIWITVRPLTRCLTLDLLKNCGVWI